MFRIINNVTIFQNGKSIHHWSGLEDPWWSIQGFAIITTIAYEEN